LRDQQLVKFEAKKPTALKPYLSEQARHAKSRGFLILWRLAKKKAIERLETWNLWRKLWGIEYHILETRFYLFGVTVIGSWSANTVASTWTSSCLGMFVSFRLRS
jgi:hypothetical protein